MFLAETTYGLICLRYDKTTVNKRPFLVLPNIILLPKYDFAIKL